LVISVKIKGLAKMMHFHQKSAQFANLNGLRLLLILLAAHATYVQSDLTPEEIQDAIQEVRNEIAPEKYCGKKLNLAMRSICTPLMKTLIMAQARRGMQKKSLDFTHTPDHDFDFESFDVDRVALDNYEDVEPVRSRFRLDDTYFANDLPFLFAQQTANRRRRRGIIEECCKNACFKTDLIHYCPPTTAG